MSAFQSQTLEISPQADILAALPASNSKTGNFNITVPSFYGEIPDGQQLVAQVVVTVQNDCTVDLDLNGSPVLDARVINNAGAGVIQLISGKVNVAAGDLIQGSFTNDAGVNQDFTQIRLRVGL